MVTCDLPACDNEASETFEVRAGAPITLAVCPGCADDLEVGLESGHWQIRDGVPAKEDR